MKCPGQDTQLWKPGDIFEAPCPDCGRIIEFFKDDTSRLCKGCATRVLNPRLDFGCAAYCAFADQCLRELPPEALAQRANIFKDRVACEMRRYFGPDQKRIRHAERVAKIAEQILEHEPGDYAVVMTAAYLHDIGIRKAEKRHQSSAAEHQEALGPEVAQTILAGLKADAKLVEEVCDIIAHHHHPRSQETDNFKVLYDADCIVNLEEARSDKPGDRSRFGQGIGENLLTETGRTLAQQILTETS